VVTGVVDEQAARAKPNANRAMEIEIFFMVIMPL
jgi:hypothetical protein